MGQFATITFIGPGEQDAARLRELLSSLLYYEPDVAQVVLIDDSSSQDFEALIPPELKSRTAILDNPRRGRGHWWHGGLCVGLCAGMKHLAGDDEIEFAVRLDTDALVINSFSDRVRAKFKSHPTAGLLGTWNQYPVNAARRLPHPDTHHIVSSVLVKAARRFAVWRHSDWPTRIQTPFSADDRLVRRLIVTACRHGYQPGHYMQGGGYAIRGQMIRDASAAGFLSESAYLPQYFGEDVLATLLCFGARFEPLDFNRPGEVFAVQNTGLPAPPEKLLENEYAILHSYKNDPSQSEAEILEYFRNRRQ